MRIDRLHAFRDALAGRLDHRPELFVGGNEDAAYHSMMAFEPTCYLRFSNFGRLIAFLPEPDMLPSNAVRGLVTELAPEHGYLLIPEEHLLAEYDGRMTAAPRSFWDRLMRRPPARLPETWWVRFFDYF